MVPRDVVPLLSVDVIDRGGNQRDSGDLTDLSLAELAEAAGALHDSLDRSVLDICPGPGGSTPIAVVRKFGAAC